MEALQSILSLLLENPKNFTSGYVLSLGLFLLDNGMKGSDAAADLHRLHMEEVNSR